MNKNNNTMNPRSIQNLLNPRSISKPRNVHQVERDWLSRHRNKERELKLKIDKLNKDIKNLQFNKDNEI